MSETKRVLVCGIAQESNCFNPILMGMSSFNPHSVEGTGHLIVAGGRDFLLSKGVECVYGVSMLSSSSGGPLTGEVVDFFLKDTMDAIDRAGRLDGVLVLLHGATMSEQSDDVCGDICRAIRRRVGEDTVIAAGFDLHACITEQIAESVDYISGYREYPHIDQRETGARAAKLLWEHLTGKRRKTARAAIPMMAPAHAYNTTEGALYELNRRADAMVQEGRIADYSVFQVQPWLDHPLVESTVVAVADDEATAIEVANELARATFACREELQGAPLSTPEEVIERALANESGRPVVLVDSADSTGAGSTGDSAAVLKALLPYADRLRAATSVLDPAAVSKAFEVGVGNTAEFFLGASIAPRLSEPVRVCAEVKGLYDGHFRLKGPIYKDCPISDGRVAVLAVGKLLVRVGEGQKAPGDYNFYDSFGIPVAEQQLVAVKACTSFRSGYAPYVEEICNAATAGAACPDLLALPFERIPHPTYPFDAISEKDIKPAKCYR